MRSLVPRLVKDESGAVAIEYGLIAGLVSIVIVGALMLAGGELQALYVKIQSAASSINP